MIAGHAPIAFALVAWLAARSGVTERRALALGLVAAGFAVVPDVDMAYAATGLLAPGVDGVWSAVGSFWSHSTAVHRAMTHSLVLGAPAAAAFAYAGVRRWRPVALALLAGLVAAGVAGGGVLGGALMALYVLAGLGVALAAVWLGLDARDTLLAALAGLLTHPFGDVFTGTPPEFLYPLDVTLLSTRVSLHPDPTLNLLSIFGLELAALWLGAATLARLSGTPLLGRIDPRAIGGAAYGVAGVVLPAPTLDVSYHFVFSVLAVGSVGAARLPGVRPRTISREDVSRAAVTGLAAVSAGGLAYALVYLLA